MAFTLIVNGRTEVVDVPDTKPLLWVLRDQLNLKGTKFGCGIAQCGYCQAGQIITAAALLSSTPNPTDTQIDAAMSNICRCGTYLRIRQAIHQAATQRASVRPPSDAGLPRSES